MVPSPSKCPAKSLGGWGFSIDSSGDTREAYIAQERLPLVSKCRFALALAYPEGPRGHVPNPHEVKNVVRFGDALLSIFSWLFGWTY